MSSTLVYWLPPLLFLLTVGLTRWYMHLCISNTWYDMPNERSAHKIPVPSGAGLVFSLVFFAAASLFYSSGLLGGQIYLSIALSLVMMLVGLADDFLALSIRIRLFAQIVLVLSVLIVLSSLTSITSLGTTYRLGLFGYLFILIGVVWSINLFNFMDGMDGLAAGEVLFICLASILVLGVSADSVTGRLMICLASVLAGFMILNFSPAKLFMGDAGSNFLGILLAVLVLISIEEGVLNLWTWLILASVFIGDSTYTLLSRMKRGAVWYHAHKSHAYQKLMDKMRDQRRVFFLLMLVNICWVLPLAVLSEYFSGYGLVFVVVAYLPMLLMANWLQAGCENRLTEVDTA